MPAQTYGGSVQYYSEGDTAPPLRVCLRDGNGEPVDLTNATVTISIAFSRPTYFYNPTKRIVDESPCIVEDQGTLKGWVRWEPEEGDLTPPGTFQYTFKVTYPDSSHQTFPPNSYLPMIIRTPVGGQLTHRGTP